MKVWSSTELTLSMTEADIKEAIRCYLRVLITNGAIEKEAVHMVDHGFDMVIDDGQRGDHHSDRPPTITLSCKVTA